MLDSGWISYEKGGWALPVPGSQNMEKKVLFQGLVRQFRTVDRALTKKTMEDT